MNILTIHDVESVTTTPWEEKSLDDEGPFPGIAYSVQRIIIETSSNQFVVELFKYPKKGELDAPELKGEQS